MYINRFLSILIVSMLMATACAPQMAVTPTALPFPTLRTSPAINNQASTPVMVVDDVTLSRLRLANLVYGSDATDMYVDGQIAVLGDHQRQLTNVPVGFISGFLYVAPGKHSMAVVPTGSGIESAMIAIDLTLEAGHRYTVGVMGQKDDPTFKPLIIDETAVLAKARTAPEQNIMIAVNNIAGADTFDFLEDGIGPKAVPYGGFVAAPIKTGHVDHLVVLVNGDDIHDNPGNFDEMPGIDFIHPNLGHFPGSVDTTIFTSYDSSFMSDLDTVNFLRRISDYKPTWDEGQKLSFDKFLTALDKAGLTSMLSSGTYMIFAPTDQAFEALPPGQFDALMANPDALADFLRYHIVKGYYPYGGLSGAFLGQPDITVTNMDGKNLKINGDICINELCMPFLPSITVTNGTRITPVSKLLMQPLQ